MAQELALIPRSKYEYLLHKQSKNSTTSMELAAKKEEHSGGALSAIELSNDKEEQHEGTSNEKEEQHEGASNEKEEEHGSTSNENIFSNGKANHLYGKRKFSVLEKPQFKEYKKTKEVIKE